MISNHALLFIALTAHLTMLNILPNATYLQPRPKYFTVGNFNGNFFKKVLPTLLEIKHPPNNPNLKKHIWGNFVFDDVACPKPSQNQK